MRPLKLTMSAFGPYSERESIDFSELQNRKLFLVTGPTGSGKTTIFDAISYALYGRASGDLRSEDTLRSHFSEASLLTEVELTFELKGMTYHVHRIPTQQRPKSRGEGTTTQTAKATLTIFDGDPKTVITGVSKVTDRIESLMGINVEQFKQIMMIPQGEFRKLLTADSQEREKVLQQLFDTQIYRKIQNELNERAKVLGSEIRGQKVQRDTLAGQLKTEDDQLQALLEAEDKAIDAILEGAGEAVRQDRAAVKKLTEEVQKADQVIEAIHKESVKAINDLKNLKEKETVRESLEKENAHKEAMDQKVRQAEAAEKAARLSGLENNIIIRRKGLEEKREAVKKAEASEKSLSESFKRCQEDLKLAESDEMADRRKGLNQQLADYQGYVKKVQGLQALQGKVQQLEKAHKEGESKNRLLDRQLKSLSEAMDQDSQEKDRLKDVGQLLEKVRNEEEALKRKQVQMTDLQDQLEVLIAQEARTVKGDRVVEVSLEAHRVGTQAYKEAKLTFLTSQAAVLARELTLGQACPVCGSVDHPSPAVLTGEEVTEEALEALEKKMKDLDLQHRKNESGLAVLKEKCANLRDKFEGDAEEALGDGARAFVLKEADAQRKFLKEQQEVHNKTLQAVQAKVNEYQTGFKRLQTLEKQVAETAKVIDEVREESRLLVQKLMTLVTDLTREQAALKQVKETVPEDLRQPAALQTKIQATRMSVDQEEKQLNAARDSYAKADKALENERTHLKLLAGDIEEDSKLLRDLEADFETGIRQAGFTDTKAYQEAKLTDEEVARLKETREGWLKKVEGLKASLKDLETKTKDLAQPDLKAIQMRQTEEEAIRKSISDQLGLIKARLEDNQATVKKIKTINDQIKDRESAYKVVGRLARVAIGQNPAMMSFERYVLAAFLEDILKAANIRLRQMTQGRYVLSRSEALQRKNRQSGLELEVFDNFTGKSRHVKTLSGGEGFKASLSMALGLSDVVQSYAGGVRLDTMFIDEGFGTLDQESLDSAISCLIDLQKNGRLVGIISHVQELKERIDTRLEIVSSNKGSRTGFVLG